MIIFRYLSARFKLLFVPLISTLLLFAVVLSAVYTSMIFKSDETVSETKATESKIKIGIVGNTKNKLLKFGLEFLENADEIRHYITTIIYEDEETAYNAVKEREISGCIIFTEEFLSAVRKGNNLPVKYITNKSTIDLVSGAVNELLETVADMVVALQSSAFSSYEYITSVSPNLAGDYLENRINLFLLDKVIDRESTVEIVFTEEEGLTFKAYYFCSGVILVALILGFVFGTVLIQKKLSLQRILSNSGCTAFWQSLCECISYIAVLVVIMLVLVTASVMILSHFDVNIPQFVGADVGYSLNLFVRIIPAISLIGVFQMLVYSFCRNYISGISMQFVISAGIAYASGCFYPASFFPKFFSEFMSKLPVGIAFDYVGKVLLNTSDIKDLFSCLLWVIVLIVLLTVVRKFKLGAGVGND